MCHCEVHYQCSRRRKTVVLFLGLLQNNIVLRAYKQPSREKVKSLIEFGKSAHDHHMNRIEKKGKHIVERVLVEPGFGHQGWRKTKSPKWKGETIIICLTLDMTGSITIIS